MTGLRLQSDAAAAQQPVTADFQSHAPRLFPMARGDEPMQGHVLRIFFTPKSHLKNRIA